MSGCFICGLNYALPEEDGLDFNSKVDWFKKGFCDSFTQKIDDVKSVAIGTVEPEINHTILGSVGRGVIGGAAGGLISLIPVVGTTIGGPLVEVSNKAYEKRKKMQKIDQAERIYNCFHRLGEDNTLRLIEGTAHEITRIYEQQISQLKDPSDILILVQYAVEKIFSDLESKATSETGSIDLGFETFIGSLLDKRESNLRERVKHSCLMKQFTRLINQKYLNTVQEGVKWRPDEIFRKVGLRKPLPGGAYEYRNVQDHGKLKCGFRGPIFSRNVTEETFVESSLDAVFTKAIGQNDVRTSYAPHTRIVRQAEFDAYLDYLDEPGEDGRKESFRNFYRRNYYSEDATPVFRDVQIKRDIKGGDFSECDLSGIFISDLLIENSNFRGCRMVSSKIRNVKIRNSNFEEIDNRWGEWERVSIGNDSSISNADFSFAKTTETPLYRVRAFELIVKDKANIKYCDNPEIEPPLALTSSFYNVRPSVEDFIGRESYLLEMKEYFEKHDRFAILSLVAAAGTGKTQTALEFVKRNKGAYDERVFWVTAENRATVVDSFRNFSEKLGIATRNRSEEEVHQEMNQKVTALPQTLFVFDNVGDFNDIRDYIPSDSTSHHILITTADSFTLLGKRMELRPFTESESIDYITKKLEGVSPLSAKALANLSSNLPLGIAQSIAYINSYSYSVAEYFDIYEQEEKDILAVNDLNSPHKEGVFTSFSMAIDKLSPKAAEILKLCAYFSADAIPVSLFSVIISNSKEGQDAIASLKGNSLVSIRAREGKERSLYISTLLQKIVKMKTAHESADLLQKAITLISGQTKIVDDDTIMFLHRSFVPHALAVIENYKEICEQSIEDETRKTIEFSMSKLYLACANFYTSSSQFRKAFELLNQYITIINPYGLETKEMLETLSCRANVFSLQGQWEKALEDYNKVVDASRSHFADVSVEDAKVLERRGYLLFCNKEFSPALEDYRECLRIYQTLTNSVDSQGNDELAAQADEYMKNEDYYEAVELYENALKKYK